MHSDAQTHRDTHTDTTLGHILAHCSELTSTFSPRTVHSSPKELHSPLQELCLGEGHLVEVRRMETPPGSDGDLLSNHAKPISDKASSQTHFVTSQCQNLTQALASHPAPFRKKKSPVLVLKGITLVNSLE